MAADWMAMGCSGVGPDALRPRQGGSNQVKGHPRLGSAAVNRRYSLWPIKNLNACNQGRGHQNINIALLESMGQMKAWLKHQKRQKEHRAQLS
jgi:hypothetical protein